ncbi:MAG: hypothetical protein ACI4OE_06940 [Alphaproteobacteria bacterium]
MTDLTDKLKAGELEPAYYYVRIQDGSIMNIFFDENHIVDINGWEVLGAVPSYEEWQAKENHEDFLQQRISVLEDRNHDLHAWCDEFNVLEVSKENQRLKQLLRECQSYIVNTPVLEQGSEQKTKEIHGLLTNIEEALK